MDCIGHAGKLEAEVPLNLAPWNCWFAQSLARIFEIDSVFELFQQFQIGKWYNRSYRLLSSVNDDALTCIGGSVYDISKFVAGCGAGNFAAAIHRSKYTFCTICIYCNKKRASTWHNAVAILKYEVLIESHSVMLAFSQLVQIELGSPPRLPKPSWLKAKAPVGDNFHNLKKLARGLGLHTVCESAQCPNIGECWNHRTATFMLLGNVCTRRCGFCAVPKGRPEALDWDEPRRVAEAVASLGQRLAVVTSVNRDDDKVGGAKIFAETIRQIRELVPECRVEVLIPDFQGLEEPLRIVLQAKPNVLNHNTETVPRLYRAVRSGARYERTLNLLSNAKTWDPAMVTKSGVLVGIGESMDELIEVFRDLGGRGVDILTIGQ